MTLKSINPALRAHARLPVDGLFGRGGACRCESCSDDPGPTYTREFRHECEVREVAAMASNDDRRRYLARVEKARGSEPAKRLREDVWAVMKAKT